jgi:hypothetical protein
MRIGGVDPKSLPVEEVLVLPRGDERIVFRATGLSSMESFYKLCPEPVPPMKLTKDGPTADTQDKNYQAALIGYQKRRTAYMVVNSLIPSQIEWDTVQITDPSTWTNWEQDLKNAGLSDVECGRVVALVGEANCLDEAKLKRARDLFLRGMPATPAI